MNAPESAIGEAKPQRNPRPAVNAGSRDARRRAALILEVLAGQRTPTDAAAALGVSVPRFYSLESQALEGLVAACEPRRRGPREGPERELAALRKKVTKLEREHARSQALLRAAQRTVGVPPVAKGRAESEGKRRRKPSVRALRAAAVLQEDSEPVASGGSVVTKTL